MNSLKTLLIALIFSSYALATTLTVAPEGSMPTTTIDGVTAIDVSQLTAGQKMGFTVSLTDINFTLAGGEFQAFFPAYLTSMSTTTADWNAPDNTKAVFVPGDLLNSASVQQLPADAQGAVTVSTLSNTQGTMRFGFLYTNPDDRPVGSVGTPNAGGELGTFWITYDPNSVASCGSGLESFRILVTPSASATSDIFANDAAARVAVVASIPLDYFGRAGMAAHFGEPTLHIRGDANLNRVRNALDALPAIRCCILGQNATGCNYLDGSNSLPWSGKTSTEFGQVFDYNCDGSVNALDALGNLRLDLGVGQRSASKTLNFTAAKKAKGFIEVSSNGALGSMASISLIGKNIALGTPELDADATKAGWHLVSDTQGDIVNFLLVNANDRMQSIPNIKVSYDRSEKGQVAIYDTLFADVNNREMTVAAKILEREPAASREALERAE